VNAPLRIEPHWLRDKTDTRSDTGAFLCQNTHFHPNRLVQLAPPPFPKRVFSKSEIVFIHAGLTVVAEEWRRAGFCSVQTWLEVAEFRALPDHRIEGGPQ